MGIILSRVRKKKSTVELLEALERDIKEIEENRSDAQRKYKKITKLFLIYSTGLYILCGIFFYFYFSSTYKEKLLYLVPLASSPLILAFMGLLIYILFVTFHAEIKKYLVVINFPHDFRLYIVKRIISWYYMRLINENQLRLDDMKKERKKILDEVMEKETYKVAKEILEKFSSDPLHNPKQMQQAPINSMPSSGLRKRIIAPSAQPHSKTLNNLTANQTPRPISQMPRELQAQNSPKYWMPAPILSLNRSYLDKFVEYLIGDGPNNRYALICSRCHSHNGMALKEEFEYIGYKCCYCYHYNPARKIKPEAPRLDTPKIQEYDSDSDSKTSSESSGTETKAVSDNEKFTSVKHELDASDTQGDAIVSTNLKSDLCSETDDKTSEIGDKLIDSTAAGDVERETAKQEYLVEEPSSSNQADDSNCDQSLLKS